ncbi:DUF2141 domain-containing protein [Marinifilum sp. D714]|uniref:DUF2141 domain-containing protein n=1 Tax=Marinifilum sp. D714 TaxID=2937523 RepID=UPI0027CF94DC|nr:DUF2141 domain-containing protein [Marinifilum sp. D714]MDQ2177912.1 DUF2141 domain-containing protein [Marinifilum sp. D714]
MKVLVITAITCLLFISNTFAQENEKSIKVQVSGLKSDNGQVIVALYSNTDNYLKNPCIRKKVTIENRKANVSFERIKAGTYAIICFHDENGNNKLDRNSKGRPMERVGVSNNVRGFFGPPKFQTAKFKVQNEDVVKKIEL